MSLKRKVIKAVLTWASKAYGTDRSARELRLLKALGHDPMGCFIVPRPSGLHPGVKVVDATGKPVAFYTYKALRRRKKDPDFLKAWQENA